MARLPSADQLGGLPSAASGRQVATYDTTAIGRGAAAFGAGLSSAATSISNVAEREQKGKADLEWTTAKSRHLTDRVGIDKERDDTLDPDQLEKFGERYKQSRDRAAEAITDPERRKKFLLDTEDDVAKASVGAQNRAFSLKRDKFIADSQSELDSLRTRGLEAGSEEDRTAIIAAGKARIKAMSEAGYISDVDAQRLDKNWTENYVVGRLEMLSPAERLDALRGRIKDSAGYVDRIIGVESSGNPNAKNPRSSASGLGQFIDSTWLEFMRARRPEILEAEGPRGALRFKNDPKLGREATEWYAQENGKKLKAAGLETSYGNVYLAHFLGPAGAIATLKADKDLPASAVIDEGAMNANPFLKGKTVGQVVAWADRKMGGKTSNADIAEILPPDRRRVMMERAFREEEQQERQTQQELRAQSADLRRSIGDDLASLETKGVELKGLTRERVASVLGDEAANDWEAERGRARKIHSALDGIETLPEGEVERRLQTLEPKAGEAGFIDDSKAYDRARKKADKFLEARRSDPALAVDVFDSVRQARASAEYTDENGTRTVTPSSAQAVVRARLAAQQELGIREPMAVTRSEARTIARQLRFIGDEDTKGMERFMRQMTTTYGDLADEVLASALQLENVNRDLAVIATDVIGKLAQGNAPTIARARQFEIAADNQTLESAMNGRPPAGPAQPAQSVPSTSDRIDTYQQGLDRMDALRRNAGNKKPGQPEAVTFDQEDVRWLLKNRNNPEAAFSFDNRYYPKASQKILADIDRRMGVKR
jgi:hypothetical protein